MTESKIRDIVTMELNPNEYCSCMEIKQKAKDVGGYLYSEWLCVRCGREFLRKSGGYKITEEKALAKIQNDLIGNK